jgi:hypothetical protein
MIEPITLFLIAAGAGAVVNGGIQTIDQQRSATRKRRRNRKADSLNELFQDSLSNDPLLRTTLSQGQTAAGQGVFNKRKVFRDASSQIKAAASSKQQQSLQTLAGLGFEDGSAQQKFLEGRIDRAATRQTGSVANLINSAHIQATAQNQIATTAETTGATLGSKQLQISKL